VIIVKIVKINNMPIQLKTERKGEIFKRLRYWVPERLGFIFTAKRIKKGNNFSWFGCWEKLTKGKKGKVL